MARVALERDDIELVAINDPFITPEYMVICFLLSQVYVHDLLAQLYLFKLEALYVACITMTFVGLLQTYMFKYDSTHGQWKKTEVTLHSEGHLTFGGNPVAIFGCR